ncbi:MAG: reverse transcriptase domain-containing protein, partial [Bacteroidota bacterium]
EYEELINMINRPDEDGVELWDFEKILNHRWSKDPNRKGKMDIQMKWAGYQEPTWEPMEAIKKDDSVSLAKYAQDMKLTNNSRWKWTNAYLRREKRFARMLKQVHLYKKKTNTIKYNFGIRIPKSIKEAMMLDKLNGNTKWADSIEVELRALYEEHKCFKTVKNKSELPKEYKYVPLLWVFAVKFDLRHRARCVAGGHVTEDLEFDIYSGVVDFETIRIALVAAILTQLEILAADISSAYIQAITIEKIYTIAGPEWAVLGLEGTILIVYKALYGLKASGAMWHRKLADNLREMGFKPCTVDHDFYIRDMKTHYEYLGVIVDDLLIFSQNPHKILDHMKEHYNY